MVVVVHLFLCYSVCSGGCKRGNLSLLYLGVSVSYYYYPLLRMCTFECGFTIYNSSLPNNQNVNIYEKHEKLTCCYLFFDLA